MVRSLIVRSSWLVFNGEVLTDEVSHGEVFSGEVFTGEVFNGPHPNLGQASQKF